MGKLMNYMMIIGGLMVLMNLAGIATTSGYILGWLGLDITTPQNFSGTAYMTAIAIALGLLVTVSGIRIGFLGSLPSTDTWVAAGMAIPLLIFIGDIAGIVTSATTGGLSWVSYVIFAISVPLMLGYGLALIEWVRGQS